MPKRRHTHKTIAGLEDAEMTHSSVIKERIYEIAGIELEDDPESVINFVTWWRNLWAGWQTRAQEERLKRLLCILGELRQGPEEYKADQPAGLRPVGWDGIDDVGG